MAGFQQTCKRCLVGRSGVALVDDRAVPFEAVALQCFQDAFDCARLLSGRVDILDANQPVATALACLQIAGGCSQQGTEMKWPGG
jgi:hypothetical protein